MITCRRRILLGVVCGFMSAMVGCAFGTRRASLGYVPSAVVSPTTAAGTPLTLVRFADQRGEQRSVGEVRNGYGMRTAEVIPDQDISVWVTEGIQQELARAGYRVSVSDTDASAPQSTTLSGDVITVYCTAMFAYEGEVSFFARLKQGGKEILAKRYTGKGSAGLNWAATGSGYAESLSLALADAVRALVTDLQTALPSAGPS